MKRSKFSHLVTTLGTMNQVLNKLRMNIGWGTPASVVLHLSVVALLLFRLPDLPPAQPPEEKTVNVQIVPPPPPRPSSQDKPPKPAAAPKPPAASKSRQALQSVPPAEQNKPKQEPAPAGQEKTQTVLPVQTSSGTAEPEKDAAKQSTTQDTSPPLPDVQLPNPNAVAIAPAKPQEASTPKPADSPDAAQNPAAPTPKPATDTPAQKPADKPSMKRERQSMGMARAVDPFSQPMIFDPRIREAFIKLPINKRIAQLCRVEALAQILRRRPNTPPDNLAAGGFVSKAGFESRGSAFRSRGVWYDVDFKCGVNADATQVTSFSIALGAAVPRNQWTVRQLPVD